MDEQSIDNVRFMEIPAFRFYAIGHETPIKANMMINDDGIFKDTGIEKIVDMPNIYRIDDVVERQGAGIFIGREIELGTNTYNRLTKWLNYPAILRKGNNLFFYFDRINRDLYSQENPSAFISYETLVKKLESAR